MKKITLIAASTALVTLTILSGCTSSAEKVEAAKTEATQANENLDEANKEYLAEIETYRIATNEQIENNKKSIIEFKTRVEKEKKEARAKYNEKIAALEQKNTDMKKKLDDYKADGKDNWKNFKTEFNHDMNELGKSFSDLFVKNTK